MTKISTYQDLLNEQARLESSLAVTKTEITKEIAEWKEKLKPVGNVLNTVGKMTNRDTSNPLANLGIDLGVNFLLKKVLLRNAGWITRLLGPLLVRNYLTHEVNKPKNIFGKAVDWIKKKI
ncbi:hypothetical protein [Sediminibacterium ginsengisoli]|uniref:Uncharacterized protein n=1 Tax=Sediminibacterium ginsengisoli TaxID=413434 RepID=A0A1T4Q1J5_9BACT|nr:hypothetical protein [Sediminibacterium ginsengisoli]SJZ97632.1 hypothetical protein SAMN04488132_10793 [Sediminibacterium ginsengisoli]